MMKAKLRRALIAISFCIAFALPLLAQDTFSHPRIISVTGTAEIKVAPDEVMLILGIDSHDRDLAIAKVENDKRGKRLLSLVHAAGVEPKDIQTSALSMGPQYTEEKIPKFLGYQVSQVVAVTLTDLSKYEDLMTSILKVGVIGSTGSVSWLPTQRSTGKKPASRRCKPLAIKPWRWLRSLAKPSASLGRSPKEQIWIPVT